jgi:hypothetical protein
MRIIDMAEENSEGESHQPPKKCDFTSKPIPEAKLVALEGKLQVAGIERLILSTRICLGKTDSDILEARTESKGLQLEAEQLAAEEREEEALFKLHEKRQTDQLVEFLEEKHAFLVQIALSLKMALESLDVLSFVNEYSTNLSGTTPSQAQAQELMRTSLRKNEEFFQRTRHNLLKVGSLKDREGITSDPVLRADLASLKYNSKFGGSLKQN